MIVDQVPSHSNRRLQLAAGVGFAAVGHVVAGGPWLIAAFIFMSSDASDSVFMGVLLTGVLELVHFAVCTALGVGLRSSRWRHLGRGLLTGWVTGLIAVLGGGTALILLLAAQA